MSQRKGLADIFAALKILKREPVKLSIVGQPSMPIFFYKKQFPDFKYYPPCSNKDVRKIMTNHDALLLPSIIEGRALVQQEALSCGIPIIVTPHAGGEDLIDKGVTGHLVPIRSPEKLPKKSSLLLKIDQIRTKLPKCVEKKLILFLAFVCPKIIDFNLSDC